MFNVASRRRRYVTPARMRRVRRKLLAGAFRPLAVESSCNRARSNLDSDRTSLIVWDSSRGKCDESDSCTNSVAVTLSDNGVLIVDYVAVLYGVVGTEGGEMGPACALCKLPATRINTTLSAFCGLPPPPPLPRPPPPRQSWSPPRQALPLDRLLFIYSCEPLLYFLRYWTGKGKVSHASKMGRFI